MGKPDINEVINVLQEVNIPKYAYNKSDEPEKAVENAIAKQLQELYGKENITQQFSVGGFLALKCDIDLFDKHCGVELKLAKHLNNATAMQRVIGQVVYYAKRCYGVSSLILLVVGKEKEFDSKMKELSKFIDDMENIHFVYKNID